MATVNKDFKVKNGLIVEGANGTINGYDILTKDLDDQNYIIGLIGGSATANATANSVVLRDEFASFSANVITADLIGDVTGTVSDISNHDTDALSEGASNLYFTNARAQAAVAGDILNAIDALDTDAIEEGLLNLYFTNARAQAAVAADISSAITSAIDALTTDDIEEGSLNLYFSNTRVHNTLTAGEGLQYNGTGEFSAHLGYGLEIANNAIRIDDSVVVTETDLSGAISAHNISSNVHGVTGDIVGTTDAQTISNKTLGSNLDAGTYTITNLGAPNNSTDAATKAYVDSVSEGLHIHASAVAATTTNIALSGYGGAFPLVVDGVTVADQQRVLVKNQDAAAQNGIYVYNASSGTLSRAADFDAPAEVDGGDFIFVTGGNTNADTGWVQTSETVATIGVDPIYFTQFSGAGTFLAGYGLYLDGNTFNANANVLASIDYVDGEIDAHVAVTSNVHGVTGDIVGTTDTQTLSNKTLGNNVVLAASLDAVNSYTVKNLQEPSNNQDAATKFYVDNAVNGLSNTVSGLTTDDVAEGDNLYFTNARAEAAMVTPITGGTQTNIAVTYDVLSGTYSFVAENGVDDSTTDDLSEGSSNFYFTNGRAQASMVTPLTTGTQTNITVTYDDMTGTYSFVAENGVADSDTDDLIEGASNLYFTNARAVAALEAVTPNFTEIDINSFATQVAASTGNVATASQITAYSWPKANYRSAEFLVKVAYSTHTEVSKVLLTMDTSDNIAITEYAIVGTNGSASTITADVSGSDARLRVTTLNNNSTVTVMGTLLA